ncbi:uncharacterized protein LOC134693923 [Mytilus trossulus]|uniref:uncharacterized protein LOC134693923 n=1 Tax=Mytilus trossulus TaxID=6551 RepID=UPI00300635B3
MGPSQYKDTSLVETQGSVSPVGQTMDLTDDIEKIELDLTGLDTSDEKTRYRQNNTNGGQQISPRAAKYRDGGSKGKFAKYITVPEDNTNKSSPKSHNSLRGAPSMISGHGTTRSRGAPSLVGSVPTTSYHPGHEGTIRGLPSSMGTLTGRRNQPAYKSWNGALPNGHLPHGHTPRPGTLAFRRGGTERKEQLVHHFGIEVDKHINHRYSPGEEISGRVVYDVARNLEIRFIEFQVIGHCAITTVNNITKIKKTKVDKFLCKRKYMVGTPDGRWTSLITPGHYVSSFRFLLPSGIPSTVQYDDNRNGFSTEITYMLKVRICDEVGSTSARSNHSLNTLVKVLLSRRLNFTVRRPFDIHSVPMGLMPIIHTEDIQLSCSGVAIIDMSLDRTCYLAGDNIIVHLETQNKYARKIKSISCELVQKVTVLANKYRETYTVISVKEKNPQGVKSRHSKEKIMSYNINMPTQVSFLPSILPGCRTLHVTYTIFLSIKFKLCSGKLTMEIPISIGPATSSSNLEKYNSVPNFNRPVRFPHFNRNGDSKISLAGEQGPHVHSKFSHEGCAGLLCCFGNDGIR